MNFFSMLLLLCVLCLTGFGVEGNISVGQHAHKQRRTQLPTCLRILANMTEQQVSEVRDRTQLLSYQLRKLREREFFLEIKKHPTGDVGQMRTYNTTLTEEELEVLVQKQQMAHDKVQQGLVQLLSDYRVSGVIPKNASDNMVQSCAYARPNPHIYEGRPKVSFMVQYFKQADMIDDLLKSMEGCQAVTSYEVLVNVDSNTEADLRWVSKVAETNGLVVPVFSNNVHEIRAYNRLMHMARGDYVIFTADDDMFPANCSWLRNMMTIFEKYPDVGIVGLRNHVMCWKGISNNADIFYYDKGTGVRMQFTERVDMAPMAFRKTALLSVGGMDESLSDAGECGIISDWEVCQRMWLGGWQVATMERVDMSRKEGVVGGTHKPEVEFRCWGKQQGLVGAAMGTHINGDLELEMCNLAKQANLQHLELIDPSRCPYEAGCGNTMFRKRGLRGNL